MNNYQFHYWLGVCMGIYSTIMVVAVIESGKPFYFHGISLIALVPVIFLSTKIG